MKTSSIFNFAPVALAATLHEYQHIGKMGLASFATRTNSTGANCGIGYTYCGYILKEQKSTTCRPPLTQEQRLLTICADFDEATILTAYCAAGYCNSTSGTTHSDPMQALFVCLPESAIPKRDKFADPAPPPYTGPVKIEVLCACSGTPYGGEKNVCLNPDGDHIGRCSSSCENAS